MSQDTDNLMLAQNGELYFADVGTPAPTDPTGAVGAAFSEVGLISEEGASFSKGFTTEEGKSWQRRNAVRRWVTEDEVSFGAALQEFKGDNIKLAFGGGEITEPTPGIYKYEFPTGSDDLDERALLLRWEDEGNHYQLYFERGTVTDAVEVGLSRTALSQLPIAFKALASKTEDKIGVEFLSDDPAWEPGS